MNSSEIASHIVEDLILDMFEIGDSPVQEEKPLWKVTLHKKDKILLSCWRP